MTDATTMGEAIALSSPNGKMSKAARARATKRLADALFGDRSCFKVQTEQPTERETLLRRARELRELAARGVKPRAYIKQAEQLEAQAK